MIIPVQAENPTQLLSASRSGTDALEGAVLDDRAQDPSRPRPCSAGPEVGSSAAAVRQAPEAADSHAPAGSVPKNCADAKATSPAARKASRGDSDTVPDRRPARRGPPIGTAPVSSPAAPQACSPPFDGDWGV